MTQATDTGNGLGGRLPLLPPGAMGERQRAVYDELTRLVVPEAAEGGFVARLDDGRFIGPFNAMLRAPELTAAFGQWVAGIFAAGIDPQARQAVILTVGAAWQAEYELYAHQAAAAEAGLPAEAIAAIVADAAPAGLSSEADLARRLARAVVRDRSVPDALYRQCTEVFGVGGAIALLHLIGQYQLVSSLLVFFAVPSPAGGTQ
jgi:4-carboxymuconolactone decarboxylase